MDTNMRRTCCFSARSDNSPHQAGCVLALARSKAALGSPRVCCNTQHGEEHHGPECVAIGGCCQRPGFSHRSRNCTFDTCRDLGSCQSTHAPIQGIMLSTEPPGTWTVDESVAPIRQFATGATRDVDTDKLDFEGFLSPLVVRRFAEFMHANRIQKDGSVRASDNWQKGMPFDAYMKSGFRHFIEVWELHRREGPLTVVGNHDLEQALCALMFNVMGYLHEHLKATDTL